MSKSLAELRQSPLVGLPERTKELCLAQKLVAQVEALTIEQQQIRVENGIRTDATDDADDERPVRPKRSSEKTAPPRLAEIEAELESLWDQMRDHTGELLVRGVQGGEWRLWTREHPPRSSNDDEYAAALDTEFAWGFCNLHDLIDDLEKYVVSWNGDPLGEGDWEFIVKRAAPGDLRGLAKLIVEMHEQGGWKAPKASPKPSSTNPMT